MRTSRSSLALPAVSSALPPSGLHQLVLPEGFELGEAPGFALLRHEPGARQPRRLAPYAFWLVSRRGGPENGELVLAFLTGPRARVGLRTIRLEPGLLYRPRRLAHVLEHEGLRLDPGASTHAAHYLRLLLAEAQIPVETFHPTTGWNADHTGFQYGPVGLGHHDRFAPTYPACLPLAASLRCTGQRRAWDEATDAVLRLSPAAAVALAAALAAPLVRPMGWAPLHLLLHGPGAVSVLGAASSVFGGSSLVTRAGPSGDLLAPFWSLADLPHLLDATGVDQVSAARRRLVARALRELVQGRSLRVVGGTARLRPVLGNALVALPAGPQHPVIRGALEPEYLPLHAPRPLPAGLLAELERHHGHLGRSLLQELVRGQQRDPRQWKEMQGYPSRCEPWLPAPAALPEPYARYRTALTTALAAIEIADSYLVSQAGKILGPQTDLDLWRAQIQAAWQQLLAARPT